MRSSPARLLQLSLVLPPVVLTSSTLAQDTATEGDLDSAPVLVTEEETRTGWDRFLQMFEDGRTFFTARYRYEYVDQDPFPSKAHASTLRTTLGLETGEWNNFSGLLEFENISVIGDRDAYATSGGGTRPVVADAPGTEVNRVYLGYRFEDHGNARVGRQGYDLDNQRFVGTVSWRQNYQSYDAASAHLALGPVEAFYAYVANVNRVVGDSAPRGNDQMNSHLLNLRHEFEDVGSVSLYGYLLDYDDVAALSTNTFGARFTGSRALSAFDLLYSLEFANQTDAGKNPNKIDENYSLIELGARSKGVTFKLGRESLGGSGTAGGAFQTPLATLHAFNGWADLFLVTPDGGLVDTYGYLGAELGKFKPALIYHQFEADSGGAKYGTEWDAIVTYPLEKNLQLGIKAAVYDKDTFGADTTKGWVWLAFSV